MKNLAEKYLKNPNVKKFKTGKIYFLRIVRRKNKGEENKLK